MKNSEKKTEQGSALLVVMIFVVVVAAMLASYLVVVGSQGQMVGRSQAWNASLTQAEAGVEEAMAQLNAGVSLSANGWGGSGTNFGPLTRTLATGTYTVAIQSGTVDTIYSTGYVTVPVSGARVSRVVKVTAKKQPLFNVALGAVDNINMNGKSVASDSWNSHDPTLSTNGQFNPNWTSTNGDVASVQGIVNIGQHTIDGSLYLGPTASYASSDSQVLGSIYNDFNVSFPDVSLPTTTANGTPIFWVPAPGNTSAHDFTVSGDYVVGDSGSITVEPGVTVTLDVRANTFNPGTVTINGGTTNPGTLIMYQEAGTATLGGNNSAAGNRPENFYYYGLPGVTAITLSGTSAFVGAIYAPEAALTLNGGGNSNNLQGAAIVNQVTLNGHYDFHYDEALGTNGPSRGFIPLSWQEL